MVIYVDILLIVNFIIDYFLICLTSKFTNCDSPFGFRILASVVAALSAFYIFLPQSHFLIELSVRAAISFLVCFIAFPKRKFKKLISLSFVFFAATFLFAGAMIFIWLLFKPNGMAINNSVVYFDISPLFLIAFSVAGYFVAVIIGYLIEKNSPKAKRCSVEITANGQKATLEAIIDTGNSLTDVFGNRHIIVCDISAIYQLFGANLKNAECQRRYRAVPCSTVAGEQLLDGYRSDNATIILKDNKIYLDGPILAISKTPLKNCGAIINPKSIT